MKAVYRLMKRNCELGSQKEIYTIVSESIEEAAKIAYKKYGIKVTHVSNLAGLHSYSGT